MSKLKLNDDKTKMIVFSSPRKCSPVQYDITCIGCAESLSLSQSVKSLGVILVPKLALPEPPNRGSGRTKRGPRK